MQLAFLEEMSQLGLPREGFSYLSLCVYVHVRETRRDAVSAACTDLLQCVTSLDLF